MDIDAIPWGLLEGRADDGPFLVRYREFPPTFPRTHYPVRLNLFWSMSQPDDNGLASEVETERLEQFENRLVAAVESDAHSVFVAALTGKGMREFVFHTADVPGFLQRLTAMPQEAQRYPIEIHRHDDQAWAYFDEVTKTSRS
jgi:hypothetical protein